MHRDLRNLLHSAEGQSQHVIALFLDVRGFSSFAKIAESSDTAEFLKSVYVRILDEYVSEADFFKPTGDGLVVIFRYDRESLTDAVRNAVSVAVRLVEDFPTMCADDPMVNFEVPKNLGVGLARGAATVLTSGDKVLDYSGRPLNLAARLMDLARPAGVVFDDSFGLDLLEESVQQRFVAESVYVKGIAEDDPIVAHCLGGYADVPAYNRSPMNRLRRHTERTEELTLRELMERAPTYRHLLRREPARTDDIDVHIAWPATRANGTKHPKMWKFYSERANYLHATGRHYGVVNYDEAVKRAKAGGVKGPWNVRVTVEYSVADEDGA